MTLNFAGQKFGLAGKAKGPEGAEHDIPHRKAQRLVAEYKDPGRRQMHRRGMTEADLDAEWDKMAELAKTMMAFERASWVTNQQSMEN